jgi:hypothetical protein
LNNDTSTIGSPKKVDRFKETTTRVVETKMDCDPKEGTPIWGSLAQQSREEVLLGLLQNRTRLRENGGIASLG